MTSAWLHRFHWLALGLLVLCGPLLGTLSWLVSHRSEAEKIQRLFDRYLNERAYAVQKDIHSLAEELYHFRSSFLFTANFSRQTFRLLAGDSLSDHPAIRAIEWAPRIPAGQLDRHEQEARLEGFPNYRVLSFRSRQDAFPSPQKTEYFPVYFIEPLETNREALGFDLTSEETRRSALQRALVTGRLAVTPPVKLIQASEGTMGILVFYPVYRPASREKETLPGTPEGVFLMVLSIHGIIKELLDGFSTKPDYPMEFRLIDESAEGEPNLIAASPGASNLGRKGLIVCSRWIEFADRRWRLYAQPSDSFLAEHRTHQPLAMGLVAFLLWELLGGLFFGMVRQAKEAAVRKEHQVLNTVIHSMMEGVIVADSSGKILLFNENANRILRIRKNQIDLDEWSKTVRCLQEDCRTPHTRDQLPLSLAIGGKTVRDMTIFVEHPDCPSGIWINVNGSPLLDSSGKCFGGVVVFRDISQKKAQEDRLRHLSNAIEQTADIIFITDRRGTIEYVNPAVKPITGYKREEVLGQTPRLFQSGVHDDSHYNALWRRLHSGEVFQDIFINRKKNGDLFHAEQTITPIRDSFGQVTHFVSVIKDITERLQKQEQDIEMRYASQVQKKLYPDNPPQITGLDISGAVFPAVATCGDYFDHFPMADGRHAIAVGDVCGHGLGPALIMASIRAYLRSLSGSGLNPDEIFASINASLFQDLEENSFVTLLLACIDPLSRRMVFVSAGHTPGYHLDSEGRIKAVIEATGIPLGILTNTTFACSQPLDLCPGDMVVMLTDGVTECPAPDGSFFEAWRALDVIRSCRSEPSERIVETLHQALVDYSQGLVQQDDITVVVGKVL